MPRRALPPAPAPATFPRLPLGVLWLLACLGAPLALTACGEEDPAAEALLAEDEDLLLEGDAPPLRLDGKGDAKQTLRAFDPLPAGADLSGRLEVLFAPDDPIATLELGLIAEVVAARQADPTARYPQGDNPYQVRYAVYNLRNPPIVEALIAAERANVDVQILIEHHQLDPAKTHNQTDETLIAAGFSFAPSQRGLTPEARRTTDLIGIQSPGLMHLKTRLFTHPGGAALLTGSVNPGDNAMLNEENLQLIRDPALVARYAAAFEAVRDDRPLKNEWDPQAPVNVLFTPAGSGPRASARLFDWLAAEEEQILLMVFSLRDVRAPDHSQSLVELLTAKAKAGVPVWVITDRKQSDGVDADGVPLIRNDPTEDRLRAGGVRVYEATNRATPFTAMHHKTAILGRSRLRIITDAANWSTAALGTPRADSRNVESVLFIDSQRLDGGRVGRRYLAQWLKVLSRYAAQSRADGEPPFDQAAATLLAETTWPTQAVRFEARAETHLGERVEVRGDAPALGAWGPGPALETDPARYPRWESVEAAALPVGASFRWKLTIAGHRGLRWESGENRAGFAQPSPLLPKRGALHPADWR